MTNPLDDYLNTVEKTAAPLPPTVRGWAGEAGSEVLKGGLSAIGAGVIGAVGLAGLKLRDAAAKRLAYNEMLEQDADLKAFRKRNPEEFNRTYNSLRSVAPRFAADPVLAAYQMRNLMGVGDGHAMGGQGLMAAAESHSKAFGKPSFSLGGGFGDVNARMDVPL